MSGVEATRILVVEDDRAVRSFLARALESGGYEPVLAPTGEEALTALQEGPPVAVALVDGVLPDMHGMRLARRILELPGEDAPAICFVTGGISESTSPVAGLAVLSKPMRLGQLLAMVAELLTWRDGAQSPLSDRLRELERFEHAFAVGP
ncbi:MAG: response regulator [Candidatus Dormibacteria bacterium]